MVSLKMSTTIGLSRTVSEVDDDFSRKSQEFPIPLELGIGAGGQKTRMMWLLGRERSLTISSAIWIQCANVTDGQTTGDSKYGAYA